MPKLNNHRQSNHASAGFTLVELLIAFTLLGLMALMVSGILQFGTRVWDRTVEGNESSDTVRAVQTLIRIQVGRMVAQARLKNAAGTAVAFQGTRDSIKFVAPLPSGRDSGGLFQQQLTFKSGPSGGNFILAWQALDTDDSTITALLPEVSGIEYAYLAPGRGDEAPSWQEDWGGKELPLLIRLRIEFEANAPYDWPELLVAPRTIVP